MPGAGAGAGAWPAPDGGDDGGDKEFPVPRLIPFPLIIILAPPLMVIPFPLFEVGTEAA